MAHAWKTGLSPAFPVSLPFKKRTSFAAGEGLSFRRPTQSLPAITPSLNRYIKPKVTNATGESGL